MSPEQLPAVGLGLTEASSTGRQPAAGRCRGLFWKLISVLHQAHADQNTLAGLFPPGVQEKDLGADLGLSPKTCRFDPWQLTTARSAVTRSSDSSLHAYLGTCKPCQLSSSIVAENIENSFQIASNGVHIGTPLELRLPVPDAFTRYRDRDGSLVFYVKESLTRPQSSEAANEALEEILVILRSALSWVTMALAAYN